MGEHVLYKKKNYKAYIILNKPEKLNTLDDEMYHDILRYLRTLTRMKTSGLLFSKEMEGLSPQDTMSTLKRMWLRHR